MSTETRKPKRRLWRILRFVLGVLLVAGVVVAIYVPRMNNFQVDGHLQLSGPQSRIKVIRDEKGMPYVHAENLHDAMFGQGFVAAQDRLFQMQLMRLQAEGRLTELVGDQARETDIKNRTIGIARAAKKHAEILDEPTRATLQAYVDGINAFLDDCPDDLPIEFRLAGISPDRWKVADSLSILYLMSWDTSANLSQEIIGQMLVDTVGADRAAEISPININPDDPEATNDASQRWVPSVKLEIAADRKLRMLAETGSLRAGSNNWASGPAVSAGEHAIIAGDPHLDPRMLPGIMYSVGLLMPGARGVGAGVPGIPGFIVGRNENVATAVTNSYGDVQDLYIETLDLEQPGHYREGGKSIPFDVLTETLKIRDTAAEGGFRSEEIKIRSTKRGPVVSDVLPGLDSQKVITLRWAAIESMQPNLGLTDLLNAKSIDDVEAALMSVTSIVLNFVFADANGNIAWRVSGRVPLRSEGSGTLPHSVDPESEWEDNWLDWIPFDEMPHQRNPDRGWVGTANHFTVPADYPYYFTNYASPSYRYRRLTQRISEKSGQLTVDDHWSIQRDTKNLLAESVTPILVTGLLANPNTKSLGDVLRQWNFRDDTDQAGPTIFQTVYMKLAKEVFRDELGDDNAEQMLRSWYFWQERFEKMVRDGDSPWFDDITTKDKRENLTDMIARAGNAARTQLESELGADPSRWQWGRIHTMQWVNPIRRSGTGSQWLGTKPLAASGSAETLYRGWYDYENPFAVTHTAAVRMVADFGDRDKVRAVMAGGEVARTFHRHQKDQIDAYMSGQPLHWWFSEQAIADHTKSTLQIIPK